MDASWNIQYSGERLGNSHALIVGGSGSGKTYFIGNVLIPSIVCHGARVIVFDYNGDYADEEYIAKQGRGKIRLVKTHIDSLAFNPFVIPPPAGEERLAGFCIDLSNVLAKVFRLGDQQRSALNRVLISQYKAMRVPDRFDSAAIGRVRVWPTFTSVVAELSNENQLAANRLQDLASLEVFSNDGNSFSDLLDSSCVIALKDLAGEYTKEAVSELVMRSVYANLLKGGRKPVTDLFLIVDEAHKIANLPATSVLLREARKFGCGVILSSQRPGDFSGDVLANVATRFVFKANSPADAKVSAKELLNDVSLMNTLLQLKLGECVMNNAHFPNSKVKVSAF